MSIQRFTSLDDFDKLKTTPKGYAADHVQIDLLRHRSFVVRHFFTDKEVPLCIFSRRNQHIYFCKITGWEVYFLTIATYHIILLISRIAHLKMNTLTGYFPWN